MKLLKVFAICLTLALVLPAPHAKAEMPPKLKAFLMVSAYGAVGGAMLGFASMAFGSTSRAIAQGASLGLYAGMIFGGYVITSHKKAGQVQYGPEEGMDDGYGGGGFGSEGDSGYFGPPQRGPEFKYSNINRF